MLSFLSENERALVEEELRIYPCPASYFFNYTVALEIYFVEVAKCYKVATDIEDGLIVDEAEAFRALLRSSAFFKVANESKKIFGGSEPIITIGESYSICKIEIVNGHLITDKRVAKREARRIINDLTYTWDFRAYEIAIYAMALIEVIGEEKEDNVA